MITALLVLFISLSLFLLLGRRGEAKETLIPEWNWVYRKETVRSLRQDGWDVHVQHFRVLRDGVLLGKPFKSLVLPNHLIYAEFGGLKGVDPRGGRTALTISKDGKSFTGEALCMDTDNYCRKEGVGRALDRACDKAGIPRPEGWEELGTQAKTLESLDSP